MNPPKIGFKQAFEHSNNDNTPKNLHKLPPLPISRKDLLNSHELRERFQLKGDKYFAKLSASGPETLKILQGIKRSHSIKSVLYFEFDPYLCDFSNITYLRTVCHKIKETKRLNLVIRRVDDSHELENLSRFISRFTRIRAIRVEFPNTQKITENALIELEKAIGNCSFLKTLERIDVNMPEKSQKLAQVSSKTTSKLRWLENVTYYTALKKGMIKNQLEQHHQHQLKHTHQPKLKRVDVTISMTGEWASMGEESEENIKNLKLIFSKQTHIEKMKFKLIRTFSDYQHTLDFFIAISILPNMHYLEFELLNCQLSDITLAAYAHGLMKMKHLKYFSFKVFQNPSPSEDCIEKFASVISKIESISNFDLYFRRLNLPPQRMIEFGNKIQSLTNIQCSCSKELIHIYNNR